MRDRRRRQADPATAEVARVEPARQGFSVPLILLPAVCLRPSVEAADSAARAVLEVGTSVPGGWVFSFFQARSVYSCTCIESLLELALALVNFYQSVIASVCVGHKFIIDHGRSHARQ